MNLSNNNAEAIPLAIEPRLKWFVNNQRFADVTFLVGEEKEIVHAHKNIIASGSPVFERMFFADHDLQMNGSKPIEIPDLTPTGFVNMLKYIYTNNLKDLDLSELFETFVAGDKYQVYNMNETMFSFIKDKLTSSNCCIIYDQLMKFPSEYVCVPVDEVKKMIRWNSASAFKNEHFVNISRETLVDLLSMDGLTINEIDVLKFCANWVAEEVERLNLEPNPVNKQEIFKPIKSLIRFSDISLQQLEYFSPITDLLSSDELNSLLLHHLKLSKLVIECNTARKELKLQRASCNKFSTCDFYELRENFSEFSLVFKANRDIFITTIHTLLPKGVENLVLSINGNCSGQEVELNYEKSLDEDSCWYFRFIDPVKLYAAKNYKFDFKFRNILTLKNLSKETVMISDDRYVQCELSSFIKGFHCMKRINFYQIL